MAAQPWRTDRWFTSPWNFVDEVREQLHLPDAVQVHDVTLRDGEQQAGVVLTSDDKVRIAEVLAEAGVHRIEAGLPAVSPAEQVQPGPDQQLGALCLECYQALAVEVHEKDPDAVLDLNVPPSFPACEIEMR